MEELTEPEKRFLALAIQGLTLRQGRAVFPFAIALTRKLGIEGYLKEYLESWISHNEIKGRDASSLPEVHKLCQNDS